MPILGQLRVAFRFGRRPDFLLSSSHLEFWPAVLDCYTFFLFVLATSIDTHRSVFRLAVLAESRSKIMGC